MNKKLLNHAIAVLFAMPTITMAVELDPLTATERHQQAYEYRENQAYRNKDQLPFAHLVNNDETAVALFQGQFHKSLPHDGNGVVDQAAYNALLNAIQSGTFEAFEAVPAGGVAKLANPLAAQVYDLEGRDSHDYGIKPAPSLGSAETAAEMVEVYLKALSRDIPFANFGASPRIQKAALELAGLVDFKGPVNQADLFRGIFAGDQEGPYVSQFLYKDIPLGPKTIDQKYTGYLAGQNFMTSFPSWLAIQNGQNPTESVATTKAGYITTGRDLSAYVHRDFTYQAFQNAALILLGMGPNVWDDGNSYKTAARQGAFVDRGAAEILDMVARAGNASLRAAWFQKWNVHRRLRPEAYGGLAQTNPGLLHPQFLTSYALKRVQTLYGSPLLPMAYPEGSPNHPAYPAGHASISGACVTVLKAFFKEDATIASPVEPGLTRTTLQVYGGTLTVGGELNKLASNISLGRDWAGVHYRSDGSDGILLGEQVGIAILKDWRDAHPSAPKLTLVKFDGEEIRI